jgi:predicted MFS family arabinose efflux permease
MLASSAVLLVSFVLIQMRSKNPLLPLRIVLDRSRGGAYLAMGLAGAGMFGVFLFLTFYLQNTLGFSPIRSGLAFLPMSAAIIATATTATTRLVPRVGPKPLVITGMSLATVAMVLFAQLQVDSGYALHILPGLVILGVGLGLVFAPAFSGATVGVAHSDAGVASAMVNTSQQVGGSVGTALLSTLAGSAVTSYAVDHGTSQAAMAAAAVHGYTTAFWVAAGVFAFGTLVVSLVMRTVRVARPAGEPAAVHA